ncbi:hypothetical protein QFC19_004117 [Naganishia cerealis]|uniref:Uncharacterized protein n=1 Tax=Naganishia cerealis TaxID=610337 RepID=A0ACC2VYI5_9TREE|nr:hypothetical protein QFC19_004117 [Naganishia cerealis]
MGSEFIQYYLNFAQIRIPDWQHITLSVQRSEMPHPLIGKPAPPLTLPSTPDGTPYTLPIGQKPIAIFFFPKAFTTGCTKEACAFRDAKKDNIVFQGTGSDELEVVGISRDAVEKQTRFVDEHKLNYRILSDPNGAARKSYSVSKAALGLIDG